MKKLAIACLLVLSSTVVIAGSKEVAPVSSGSASSTFGVGVPHFSAAPAVRGAAAPAAKGGPAAKKGGPAAKAKGGAAADKKGGASEKKAGRRR